MVAFQAVDPGSIPGRRTVCFLFLYTYIYVFNSLFLCRGPFFFFLFFFVFVFVLLDIFTYGLDLGMHKTKKNTFSFDRIYFLDCGSTACTCSKNGVSSYSISCISLDEDFFLDLLYKDENTCSYLAQLSPLLPYQRHYKI